MLVRTWCCSRAGSRSARTSDGRLGGSVQTQAAAASLGFRETATTWPEVRALYEVAGRFDYLLHVAARDTDHLRSFRNGRLAIHDRVRSIETALIFDHWRAPLAPDWASAATETGD